MMNYGVEIRNLCFLQIDQNMTEKKNVKTDDHDDNVLKMRIADG